MVSSAGSDGIDAADIQKKERVKARWGLLRQALLGNDSNDTTNCNTQVEQLYEHSMNSFPGFKVLDRTILPNDDENNNIDANWDIVQYSYTTSNGHRIQFKTREAKEQQPTNNEQKSTIQSRVEALLSHRTHGVDNTGNVRVWDAETTLAGFILSTMLNCGGDNDTLELDEQTDAQLVALRKSLQSILNIKDRIEDETTCNILELGAGQAGLAGLALASAASTSCTGNCTDIQSKPLHVVLTDGHPKCVENNKVCAKMLSSVSSDSRAEQSIDTHLLLWDSSPQGADACHEINNLVKEEASQKKSTDEGQYQLCLLVDCVHFQEFHHGLLLTIARTLEVNGIALLCQPRRGTSLQNFMILVDAVNEKAMQQTEDSTNQSANNGPLFQMTLYEHFYPKVSEMHKSLILQGEVTKDTQQCSSRYNPNWHQPLLLVLQKLRPYSEEVDGEIARQHMQTRSK